MNDENAELKNEIYTVVDGLLDANHKRMIDWEKNAIANIQGNVADLLRDVTPKPTPMWHHIIYVSFQGITIGLSMGLILHFFK